MERGTADRTGGIVEQYLALRGTHLALALVEEDLGREIAMRVASQLVMFFKRPGRQMQFSCESEAVPAGRATLQELQRWVAANPALYHRLDQRVANLARRMDLSPQHFSRLFRSEVGMTPDVDEVSPSTTMLD